MTKTPTFSKDFKWRFSLFLAGALFMLLVVFIYNNWEEIRPERPAKTDVYTRLMEGNMRFAIGQPRHPDESVKHRKEIAAGQSPFALVVTCSDSRLSPELIFDQGLGDLFVIRTAGNLVSEMELGSIEYAIEHLGIRNILIMGHEHCGAVEALMSNEPYHGHIKTIIDSLQKEKEIQPAMANHNLNQAIVANIRHQVEAVGSDPAILEAAHEKKVSVKGLYYALNNGKVYSIDSFQIH